jgi:glycosyltransferase involved in cell wall biosynthesis
MAGAPTQAVPVELLPSISIVTPSFQQARFVEKTIRSVINQGYPRLEYLVLDGGSTDGSIDIIREYEDRLDFWSSEADRGQAHAINKGFRQASGELLGWLNSDDTLAPGALLQIGRLFLSHPHVDLVYGHTLLIDDADRVVGRQLAVPTNLRELIYYNRNMWSQPGTFWRRGLYERTGPLDESLHYAMDCDFWIRAASVGIIFCLPHHLANLRIHSGTKSTMKRSQFLEEHKKLDQRYGNEFRTGLRHSWFGIRKRIRVLRRPANWIAFITTVPGFVR